MKFAIVLRTLWPVLLVLFMGISVAQLSERLKNKAGFFAYPTPGDESHGQQDFPPTTRTDALLGTGCILLAAFWGLDALLSWYMFSRF